MRLYSARIAYAAILMLLGLMGCGSTDDGSQGASFININGQDDSNGHEPSGHRTPNYADAGIYPGSGYGGAGGGGGWDGAGGAGGGGGAPQQSTNIALGGAQDFGYFRRLVEAGEVPQSDNFDAAGFFAEHHTPLPPADCGQRVCLQSMLGVMGNLINGNNCTLIQLGLNSPITVNPDARPPLDLTVVVDTSGSMRSDGKMNFVRHGLRLMANELRDEDRIAIISYSSQALVQIPMTPLVGNRNLVRTTITDLEPGGGTNIFGGLEAGYEMAGQHYNSGRQARLILLSDGRASAGNTNTEDIIQLSRDYNSDGIGLTTVGLGTSFNYDLMRRLAEQGDGNFYFVENADAVEEVFTEELSYFTLPVAFDVEVTMTPSEGYRLVRAYGSSFFNITDEGVGSLEVPSVFLAHREAHDDVGEGGTRRGGGSALLVELMPMDGVESNMDRSPVAHLSLRFREPGSDEIVKQMDEVVYPNGLNTLLNQGFFDNQIVEKSFVVLNIYVALVMATESFHLERDIDGAISILQMVRAAAEDYEDSAHDGAGDVDIQFDIELLSDLIQLMQVQGGELMAEDELPEDPWPAD